jgi:hypothetical protein
MSCSSRVGSYGFGICINSAEQAQADPDHDADQNRDENVLDRAFCWSHSAFGLRMLRLIGLRAGGALGKRRKGPARIVLAQARKTEQRWCAGVLGHPRFPSVVLRQPQADHVRRLLVGHDWNSCKWNASEEFFSTESPAANPAARALPDRRRAPLGGSDPRGTRDWAQLARARAIIVGPRHVSMPLADPAYVADAGITAELASLWARSTRPSLCTGRICNTRSRVAHWCS